LPEQRPKAKRYSNTIDVAAVRELHGTVLIARNSSFAYKGMGAKEGFSEEWCQFGVKIFLRKGALSDRRSRGSLCVSLSVGQLAVRRYVRREFAADGVIRDSGLPDGRTWFQDMACISAEIFIVAKWE
jgi:hypothetical protein